MRSKWAVTSILLAVVLITLISRVAGAGPAEDTTFANFEAVCLTKLNQPEEIPETLEITGAKPATPQFAKLLLGGQKGKAWVHIGKAVRTTFVLTDAGVCTVSSPEPDGVGTRRLFENNTRNIKLRSDRLGSQEQTFYAVTFPDPRGGGDIRAIVILTISKLESIKGIFLNALPETALPSIGMKPPKWP